MKLRVLMAMSGALLMSASAATISWTSTPITGAGDVSTNGTLIEALNFSGGTTNQAVDRNTAINGVTFSGFVSGTTNNSWIDPDSGIFSANSDKVTPFTTDKYKTSAGGLAAYDVLMSQYLNDGGVSDSLIVLQSLTPFTQYEVQLFIADTVSAQSNSIVKIDGTFTSDVYTENPGVVLTGTFGADAATQSFNLNKFKGGVDEMGLQLNAYQLRNIGVVEIPGAPTGLVADSGNNRVFLNWYDNGEPDLDHYSVCRSINGIDYFERATTNVSEYIDGTVTNGGTYFYVVVAVDTDSNESAVSAAVTGQPSEPPDGPNIIFIMSDDHCTQAVGAYGGRLAGLDPTPNIDTLAEQGMRFLNCFCPNSICTPSRANIMTGQYNHINEAYDLGGNLPPDRQYLAELMTSRGYSTAVVGKWHLKLEPAKFDYYKVLPGQGSYFDTTFRIQGPNSWPDNTIQHMGYHSSDIITDSALNWLHNLRNPDKPFFLMLHYKAPHGKWEYASRYESYLAGTNIPEPEENSLYDQSFHGSVAINGYKNELRNWIGSSVGRRHGEHNQIENMDTTHPDMAAVLADLDAGLITEEEAKTRAYQVYLKAYLRCVKGVDDNLGRVFDYLKGNQIDRESGGATELIQGQNIFDDTVIIYTGDQGFWLGEHDYIDKRWPYRESTLMPFIVRYPGVVSNGVTDAIIENVDFGPTMLDYAGVATPSYMQGRSFRAILETGTEPVDWKQEGYSQYWMHLTGHYNPSHCAIHTKQYSLIYFYGYDSDKNPSFPTPPAWELYDHQVDPFQMNNVYDNENYASVATNLKSRLALLRTDIRADDDSLGTRVAEANIRINDYWDYDSVDRKTAVQISHTHAAARMGDGYTAPTNSPIDTAPTVIAVDVDADQFDFTFYGVAGVDYTVSWTTNLTVPRESRGFYKTFTGSGAPITAAVPASTWGDSDHAFLIVETE